MVKIQHNHCNIDSIDCEKKYGYNYCYGYDWKGKITMKLMDFSDDCRELSLSSLNKEIGYRMSMKMRKANVSDFQQQPTHPFDEGGGIEI